VKEHDDVVRLVAVVEPDRERLSAIRELYQLPEAVCFTDVSTLFASDIEVDACIIGTPDNQHYDLALKAMDKGWDILLEKPMSQTADECREVAAMASEKGSLVSVCYVLRYHPYFIKLRELSMRPEMGRILKVTHVERVGKDRTAHTYVRGFWNKTEMDTTVFLSKCCHDVDFILWLVGNDVKTVRSTGFENHFVSSNAPEGSASRCLECAVEKQCRYSAVDLYLRRRDWVSGFVPAEGETKEDAIMRALKESRYGRCVYACPTNDVIDRQVVEIEMESGVKAEIIMECPTDLDNRTTRIDFENAVIEGDEAGIKVVYKDGRESETYDYSWTKGMDYHAGADLNIVEDFIEHILDGDTDVRTSAREAVVSHVVCFMAEESRLSGGITLTY
jgi:predicted dehydrogenase